MCSLVRNLKLPVRWLLERTTVGSLALLRHDKRVSGSPGVPDAPWHDAVRKSHDEVARTLEQVARLHLPPKGDPPKNWDSLAAVDCLLKATTPKAHILDYWQTPTEAGADIFTAFPSMCLPRKRF